MKMITEQTNITVTKNRHLPQTPMPYKKKECPNIKHRYMQMKKQHHARYNVSKKRDQLDFTFL